MYHIMGRVSQLMKLRQEFGQLPQLMMEKLRPLLKQEVGIFLQAEPAVNKGDDLAQKMDDISRV